MMIPGMQSAAPMSTNTRAGAAPAMMPSMPTSIADAYAMDQGEPSTFSEDFTQMPTKLLQKNRERLLNALDELTGTPGLLEGTKTAIQRDLEAIDSELGQRPDAMKPDAKMPDATKGAVEGGPLPGGPPPGDAPLMSAPGMV